MQSIGERIKEVREKAELSQKAFGTRIELSQTAVTALENNQSEPRLGTFNKIVEAFRVNPEWLRTGKGEMKSNEAALPNDPATPKITASPLQPVAESETEKELKRRVRWLEEQVELWQKIATSGVDLSKIATGTTGSFNLGNDVADKPSVYMVVSHYQELAA